MLFKFNNQLSSAITPPAFHTLPCDTGFVRFTPGIVVYLSPHVSKGRVFHRLDETLELFVHEFELGTDAKDNLQTFLLRHLGIGETDLTDVIDNIHTSHDNLPIDLVTISGKCHCKGIRGMST